MLEMSFGEISNMGFIGMVGCGAGIVGGDGVVCHVAMRDGK